jgi:putative NADH-flavin reductase
MLDALRQEHQIAIVQLLPSLGFRVDPARTLAYKVKTKKLLLRKGDAPWMSEFAAPIVDSTQAKVLQDFT